MQFARATTANVVIDELNALVGNDNINDISLQGIKRKIDKIPSDLERFNLLGMYYCVKNDLPKVKHYFQAALRISDSRMIIADYAIALNNLQRDDLNYEHAKVLSEMMDANSLLTALKAYADCYDFENTKTVFEKIEKAYKDSQEVMEFSKELYMQAMNVNHLVESKGVENAIVSQLIRNIQTEIRDTTGQQPSKFEAYAVDADAADWVTFVWRIQADRNIAKVVRSKVDDIVLAFTEKLDVSKVVFRIEREVG